MSMFMMADKGRIPSLVDMCINTMQPRVDKVFLYEPVPSDLLHRLLMKCSSHQLKIFEDNNCDFLDDKDTNAAWKRLCASEFRAGEKELKDHRCQYYSDLYRKLTRQKEERTKMATERMKKSIKEDKEKEQQSKTQVYTGPVRLPSSSSSGWGRSSSGARSSSRSSGSSGGSGTTSFMKSFLKDVSKSSAVKRKRPVAFDTHGAKKRRI